MNRVQSPFKWNFWLQTHFVHQNLRFFRIFSYSFKNVLIRFHEKCSMKNRYHNNSLFGTTDRLLSVTKNKRKQCIPLCDDPVKLKWVGELNKVSTLECSDDGKRLPWERAAAEAWIRGSSHCVVRVLWLKIKKIELVKNDVWRFKIIYCCWRRVKLI